MERATPDVGTWPKLTFDVCAKRMDAHGSTARCKSAEISLDTDLAGRADAFNPAELLLAALAACIIKGIERVAPILHFELRGVEVRMGMDRAAVLQQAYLHPNPDIPTCASASRRPSAGSM